MNFLFIKFYLLNDIEVWKNQLIILLIYLIIMIFNKLDKKLLNVIKLLK